MFKQILRLLALCLISSTLIMCNRIFDAEDADNYYVTIDPIQCLGNPWEVDWLEKNDYDTLGWAALSDGKQIDVFIQYYDNLGISIKEVEVSDIGGESCAACTCPRGDRYQCLVEEHDYEDAIKLGFSRPE